MTNYREPLNQWVKKFKVTQQFLLNDILAKMGAEDMFSEFADFAGITPGSEKLYVFHIIHKAFVEVNEKSTEAAAATAVVMCRLTACRSYPKFCADHPFLFIISQKIKCYFVYGSHDQTRIS